MKQELYELDDVMSLATLRVEKMDWLVGHLLNSVTGENAMIVGLLADMIELAKDDLQNIDTLCDKLREQDTPEVKGPERLQKVA
ncbi:hypothetical protein [Moraxella catarrhalis]|uniref:hypothetical protein n=1 Tax=Moraxella catarrhalis TaxID=480 RepID=UPI00128B32E5|nr:hypothetical protein [Moraxella catarrhalis]MPX68748.1 hypothetical protein [Moraxella catarrhalis]MPX85504.1 hypothetical protein [Moraxella catarrhalis]